MKGHPTFFDKEWYLEPLRDAIHSSPGITKAELAETIGTRNYTTMGKALSLLIERGEIIETPCLDDGRARAFMAEA